MSKSILSYVEELRLLPEVPSFEPEIDDLDAEQDRKLRYEGAPHLIERPEEGLFIRLVLDSVIYIFD